MVKFAHMSDCHLGSWSSHPDLHELPLLAFERAIDMCIAEGVDFIIIAGDLLDTSLPGVDVLRRAAVAFRRCKEAGIQIYTVAGSHDYSPTGKTMLSVFESAGLIIDVAKSCETDDKIVLEFTHDMKTGAKLAGVFGRKGSLEVEMFERLDVPQEDGFKIFVFHCGIDEHRSIKGMSAVPVSLLPKGFNYYATGHIHVRRVYDFNGSKIAFPGPLFPTNFDELEAYDSGFYIITGDGHKVNVERKDVKIFNVVLIDEDSAGKTPSELESSLVGEIEKKDLRDSVVLIKLHGRMNGKPSDIDFRSITTKAESLGAIAVKRNISKLSSGDMEEVSIESTANIDELERKIIDEHAGKMKFGSSDTAKFVISLMNVLKEEKGEDETNASFENKIKDNTKKLVGL